jgi:hypothetical protein
MMKTETEQTVLAGESVTISPISSTDVVMQSDFIRNLSMQTKHFRFFGGVAAQGLG